MSLCHYDISYYIVRLVEHQALDLRDIKNASVGRDHLTRDFP